MGDELRFKQARAGDFLMTPFQCDVCHFRNIQGRNPDATTEEDVLLMDTIRHVNINALWSREPGTVRGNLIQAKKMELIGQSLGLETVAPHLGPFPLEDTFGVAVAACFLRRTLDPGRTEKFVQFATARKLRSAFSNAYHASKMVSQVSAMAFEANKTYATSCPTYGYFFERFVLGCHKRMGDVVVTDFALSKPIFIELVKQLELDWTEATTDGERDLVAEFAGLLIIGYLLGLRGEEIVKVDIGGLAKYIDVGAQHSEHPHVIVPLVGRLKGETGERYHMLPMARVTKSGIQAGLWMDRLLRSLWRRSRRNGFVFVNGRGQQRKIGFYNAEFYDRLARVKLHKAHLFEPNLEISNAYGLSRSLRRGSTSEATNAGVSQPTIDLNNRWRKFERSKGRMPTMSMAQHYTEVRLILPTVWEYSRSF